ncbi:hypothetical protein X546_05095 [Brevibacillus borstelensis cifa_chp40]|nr:hypothetical protein X546_05095 [Brevibacillus borstelensis cifa_chp40]
MDAVLLLEWSRTVNPPRSVPPNLERFSPFSSPPLKPVQQHKNQKKWLRKKEAYSLKNEKPR